MQLDLQSVEKIPFRTFAWAFAPKMLKTGFPRLRMSRSFLQDLSRAVSRFSRGWVAGSHRQHFFDSTGSKTITIVHDLGKKKNSIRSGVIIVFWPNWIEKVLTVISCNWAPGEAGSSSGYILEKAPTHSEACKTILQHFRGNAYANVLKGLFSRTTIQLCNNWPCIWSPKGNLNLVFL